MTICKANTMINFDLLHDYPYTRKFFNIENENISVVTTKSTSGFLYFFLKNNNAIAYAIDERANSIICMEENIFNFNNESIFFIINKITFIKNYEKICNGTLIKIKDNECTWCDYSIAERMLIRRFIQLDKYKI